MSTYEVHRYTELADAVRDGADTHDTIRVLGDTAVPQIVPKLAYRVEHPGMLIIASSSPSSVQVTGGTVRVVYDQRLALTLYGSDTPGGTVELVGFPDDAAATVARIGAPYGWDITREPPGDNETASPTHDSWLGEAIADRTGITRVADLQSWDVLDAIAPDDPHVWNALKYLTRLGRKGDSSRRIVDLRKAAAYLSRAIEVEEGHDSE